MSLLKNKILRFKYMVIFIIMILAISIYYYIGPTMTVNNGIADKVIVLDAGHGGIDGGAESKNGVLEKDLNLKITLKLKEILERENIKVLLTRDSDSDLSDNENESIKSRKNQDLNKRIEMINNSSANLLVSIHMNSFPQEKYSGWQTFYKKNCIYSSEVAKLVQDNIKQVTQIENKRVPMEINGVKIIEKSNIPSILIECGFLSNKQEAEKLNTEEYQEQIVQGIAKGIISWYCEN